MREFWIFTMTMLVLFSVNLTIPIWMATLQGYGSFNIIMDSVLGKFEQGVDIVIATLIPIMGCVAIAQMLRKK